jgi:hypothetical protein
LEKLQPYLIELTQGHFADQIWHKDTKFPNSRTARAANAYFATMSSILVGKSGQNVLFLLLF